MKGNFYFFSNKGYTKKDPTSLDAGLGNIRNTIFILNAHYNLENML